MKVTFRDHDGKGARLAAALADAGYEIVDEGGDVLLIDADIPVTPYLELCDAHDRVLLYPHGGGIVAHGDGQWPTHPNTIGQFVIGSGQAEVLERAGYPHPTAIIGWPYCDRLPFRPSEPRTVLFAPEHPMLDGYLTSGSASNTRIHVLLAALPVRLIVRYIDHGFGLEHLGIQPQAHVDYRRAVYDVEDGIDAIDEADVVVAARGTFPSLALARGCPMVMYGQVAPDDHENDSDKPHTARSWDRYKELARYPLDADDADDLMGLLIEACTDDTQIADWRTRFVGEQFDPAAFVETFEKALVNW